jgi:hypothetical protein
VATLAQGGTESGGPKTTQGVGSPLWMAPEQTNVGKVVLATDVWAVGLIAFNLVTGRSYWRTASTPGSTITALLVEIMVEELPSASVRAKEMGVTTPLPPGFDAWFARCLVRDPSLRFADASAAFPPLLAMLASRQTAPDGFASTMAIEAPSARSGATQPDGFAGSPAQVPVVSPTAFDETRPGPQLASGPHALAASPPAQASASPHAAWSSGPAPARVGPPAAPTMQMARRRAIWPWVLLGALGLGAACAIGIGYQVVRGTEQVVSGLEGHFVDPETGATVDLGPDGVHVRAGDAPPSTTPPGPTPPNAMAPITTDDETDTGSDTQNDEDADEDGDSEQTDEETDNDDTAEEDDDEDAEQEETTDDSEADEATDGARPRRARGHGRGRGRPIVAALGEASRASPADQQQYRARVIDACWRGTFEGEPTPPRARYTIDVRPSSILVTPRDTEGQQRFARCLGLRTHQAGTAPGTYVYTLP